MKTEYFPHFIRANYPMAKDLSNDDISEIGKGFKEYLEKKFEGQIEKLEPIWDIDPKTVVMAQVNKDPFRMNGYHPALFIHFENFCKTLTP